MEIENGDSLGFEAEVLSLREKAEIVKTRQENDQIHSISRQPLAPRNFDEVKYPNTLVRFKPAGKQPKKSAMEDVMNELAEMKGRMAVMERKLEKMEEEVKRNKASLRAGHVVMVRFFTDYACEAITYGRSGNLSRVIKETKEPTIRISHSVDKELAEELPKFLNLEKHAATLRSLEGLKKKMSNTGCHAGSIAGMAVAIELQVGMYDLLKKDQHPGVVSLFEDLFGISVEAAALQGDSPLYGKLLNTQEWEARKEEAATLKKEAAMLRKEEAAKLKEVERKWPNEKN